MLEFNVFFWGFCEHVLNLGRQQTLAIFFFFLHTYWLLQHMQGWWANSTVIQAHVAIHQWTEPCDSTHGSIRHIMAYWVATRYAFFFCFNNCLVGKNFNREKKTACSMHSSLKSNGDCEYWTWNLVEPHASPLPCDLTLWTHRVTDI